ncbi:MAG: hypothetical protein LBF25_00515 [Puniceicoccales bacterium]|jgi:hypothetical protein|nr:hypothetical protein [Puniceicoccales bacterium]
MKVTLKCFKFISSITLLLASAITAVAVELPDDFVYLSDVCPSMIQSVRYAAKENFVSDVVDGYEAPKIGVKRESAEGLKKAKKTFLKKAISWWCMTAIDLNVPLITSFAGQKAEIFPSKRNIIRRRKKPIFSTGIFQSGCGVRALSSLITYLLA